MIQVRRFLPFVVLAAGLSLALAGAANPAFAQDPAQRLIQQATGQELTSAQILERLRASGVSRDEARARLRQAGYDPSVVDPYYDRLEGGEGVLPDPNRSFLGALANIGILESGADAAAGQEAPEEQVTDRDRPEPQETEGLEVFGLDLFRRATDQFDPVTTGPVDPDYRLGPGDEIILILTGDVELAYTLDVTREGFLVIPDVGQISVNGLTLEGLRERLYDRLGRAYSGVRRGPDATTFFDVSLGRLRTNQVFVIGDVARPGAYQISAVGTVLNALYRGGGPTARGSFRAVAVNRGGRVEAQIDLYDYLIRGDASQDIRLEQGDVIFVPPAGAQITIKGAVRRPAIYEMAGGEDLQHLVRFAGGFEPEAHIQRVQVDRILPPARREPGRDRVLLDADVLALEAGGGPSFALAPGDQVTVFGVLDRQVGRVNVQGQVWRPGSYEYEPGMTLGDLLEEADGLLPWAYTETAHIRRLLEATGENRLIRVALERDASGRVVSDVPLEDLDEVVVYSVEGLRTADSVQVFGLVKNQGTYLLDENTTVEDVILAAGGFSVGAQAFEAEVVRSEVGTEWSERIGTSYRIRVDGGIPDPLKDHAPPPPADVPGYDGTGTGFVLRHGDQVFVRRLPGYMPPTHARVSGEVQYPGLYGFELRQERLSTLIQRAGGLTADAYPVGARLVRDSILVGIELEKAIGSPGGEEDVLVEPGDQLVIPRYDPTVLVTGAVAFQARVLYGQGGSVKRFLSGAGGAIEEADLDRVSVLYPNGERAVTDKFLFFRDFPDVRPGSTIFVPRKPESAERNWDQIFTRTLSITSTVLTILVAVDRLK